LLNSNLESDTISMRELRINDILIKPELEQILGEDVVFVIRCFTGPLQSMNVRNLCWHGFIGTQEFKPSFASFLFILIFNVGSICPNRTNVRKSIDMTAFMSKRKVDILEEEFRKEHIIDIIDHSYFIAQNRLGDWKKAISLFYDNQYFYSIIMLLPLLEHSLRRVFGYVNECPERIYCAETSVTYTTFDEMLDPDLDEHTPNALYAEIGPNVLNALFDILVWKDGPRIRDKLAHGMCDPAVIPRSIPQMIINCALYLCYKYSNFPESEQPDIPYHELYSSWYEYMSNYETLFHPSKFLVRNMTECYKIWKEFHFEFVTVGKSTEPVKREITKPLVPIVDDVQLLYTAIDQAHDQIRAIHSSKILFHHDHADSVTIDYSVITKKPSIPIKFTSKIGNCSSVELTAIYMLRKTTKHVCELIVTIKELYEAKLAALVNRRAPDRKLVAKLLFNMNHFSLLVQMIMSQVHLLHFETFNQSNNTSEKIRTTSMAITVSLISALKTNSWEKVKRRLLEFIEECIAYNNNQSAAAL
jgi:hypothetical protein